MSTQQYLWRRDVVGLLVTVQSEITMNRAAFLSVHSDNAMKKDPRNPKKTVGELARILKVDKKIVQTWAYKFRDYLSSPPSTGETRYFTQKDLMVLGLVSHFWEDDPDYEHICIQLNRGDQYSDQYVSFAYLHTPLFQNYPDEDITDAPCYASFSPIKPPSDELSFRIAEAYKDAGDILVETALSSNTAYELKYPILYTYRHAMEVYLKILLLPDKYDHTHQFLVLVEAIQAKYKADFPSWTKDRLEEFEEMDRLSDAFRYADSKNTNKKNRNIFEGQVLESEAPLYRQEMVLSIKQLRVVINHICTGLKNKILDSNVPPACYS